jgi:hypothetical protein
MKASAHMRTNHKIAVNLPSVDVSLPSTIAEATNSKIEVLIENQRTDIEKLITFPPLPLQ